MCVGVFMVYGHGARTVRTLFKVALAGLVLDLGADETVFVYISDLGIQDSPVLEIHCVRNLESIYAENAHQFAQVVIERTKIMPNKREHCLIC